MNSMAAYWSSPPIRAAAAWCFAAFLLITAASRSTCGRSTWTPPCETSHWIPLRIFSSSLHSRFFGELHISSTAISSPLSRPSAHSARIEISIHIRSLTTGKVHPLATESPVLVHDVDLRTANLTFMVQIHSDRLAVHFISHGMAPSELVVWNWKTGETLLVRQH